jgi:hypothetical protein
MRRITPLILITLALGLAGCATTGPSYEEMSGQIPALNPDAGRIFFYLTEYPVKTALIKVNGERVGLLGPMSFFYVDRPAGEHTLQVFRGHTGIISLDKMLLKLAPGETRYVEVLGIDRRLRLLLTEPADAQQTIRKCTFFDPSSRKDEEEKP